MIFWEKDASGFLSFWVLGKYIFDFNLYYDIALILPLFYFFLKREINHRNITAPITDVIRLPMMPEE